MGEQVAGPPIGSDGLVDMGPFAQNDAVEGVAPYDGAPEAPGAGQPGAAAVILCGRVTLGGEAGSPSVGYTMASDDVVAFEAMGPAAGPQGTPLERLAANIRGDREWIEAARPTDVGGDLPAVVGLAPVPKPPLAALWRDESW